MTETTLTQLTIDPSQVERVVQMLTDLRVDIASDVLRREKLLLTGDNVAVALGEICAQVDALAHVLLWMLEESQ